jgi:hypothetical protein
MKYVLLPDSSPKFDGCSVRGSQIKTVLRLLNAAHPGGSVLFNVGSSSLESMLLSTYERYHLTTWNLMDSITVAAYLVFV